MSRSIVWDHSATSISSAIIVNAFEGMHCPPSVAAAIVKRTEPDRLPFYLEELAHFVRDKLTAQGDSVERG